MSELDRLNEHVRTLRRRLEPLDAQMARVIVGQRTLVDRLMLGLSTLFVAPCRIAKLGALIKPATLFKFH